MSYGVGTIRYWLLACLLVMAPASAEIGVTNDDVLFGQSAALAGPAAELGTDMRIGANLAFRQVNQKGGIYRRDIKLITMDDGYEPARAIVNTKKLISEDKVFEPTRHGRLYAQGWHGLGGWTGRMATRPTLALVFVIAGSKPTRASSNDAEFLSSGST